MIKPVLKRVLIEVIKEEVKSASGIIMPDSVKKESMRDKGIVVGFGSKVDFLKEGQTVLFTKEWGSEMIEGGKTLALVDCDSVLAIMD